MSWATDGPRWQIVVIISVGCILVMASLWLLNTEEFDREGTGEVEQVEVEIVRHEAQNVTIESGSSHTSMKARDSSSASSSSSTPKKFQVLPEQFKFPESLERQSHFVPLPKYGNCFTLCGHRVCHEDIEEKRVNRDGLLTQFLANCSAAPGLQSTRKFVLPYYALIGYSQSGSTFLSSVLVQHANILRACQKEVYYLTSRRFFEGTDQDLEYYLRCFETLANLPPDRIIGDHTVNTIYHEPSLPHWLKLLNPNLKLLVLLRDPTKRAFSRYTQLGGGHQCQKLFGQEEKQVCRNDFDGYVDAVISYAKESCDIARANDPTMVYYCLSRVTKARVESDTIISGIYSKHVKHWLNIFPRDQFLFIQSEKLFADPLHEVKRITNFLQIPAFTEQKLRQALATAKTNPHTARNEQVLTPQAKTKLDKFYQPFNLELEQLLKPLIQFTN